jgi:CRISPR/Cas system CSM-associated protein Csm2 small subunit
MNKQIISEVSRISTLMGVKPLITEQAVPRFIKSLLNLSDDVVKKFYKTGNNVSDDLLRKVRNGESLTDDAIKLLLRNIDFQNLSKIIIDGKWLGSNFDNFVDSIVDKINKNPENTKNILNKFNNFFDNIPFLDDAPEELITALKVR